MTDQQAQPRRKRGEVTGWGLVLAAVVVAVLLAAMMLWALHFMNNAFVAPPTHR
jgi:hypothetical protein